MAFTTLPSAGEKWRSSVIGAAITELRPIWAVVTVDQALTALSTTMQDVTELVAAVAANSRYFFIVRLVTLTAGTVIDVKAGFTFPTGCQVTEGQITPEIALGGGTTIAQGDWSANSPDTTSPTTAHIFGSANQTNGLIVGDISVGSTAGNLQVQAAENSSNATQPSIKIGSSMILWKVG